MQRLVRAAHTQRVGRPNRSKQTPNRGKRGMNMTKVKPSIANTSLNAGRRRFPLTLWVVVLLVLLLLSVLSSITFGPVDIAIPDVARILVCRIFRSEPAQYAELLQSTTADIIWNIRFPRVLMAMVVGAGLSVSGVVMQAVVRNPLADPYVLGLSSGASLGATLAILLGAFSWFGNYGVSVGAFLGSLVTALFVFTVAFSGKSKGNTIKLLLAGMAVSAICSAFTNFVIYTASDAEGIRSVTFWTMGGMTSASWNLLGIPFVVVLLGVAFFPYPIPCTQHASNRRRVRPDPRHSGGNHPKGLSGIFLRNHRCCSSCIRNNRLCWADYPPCCAYACRFRSPQGIGVINDSRIYFFDLV